MSSDWGEIAPKQFLKDYKQVLLADAYGGYDGRRYRPGATGRLIVVAERPLRLDRVRSAS